MSWHTFTTLTIFDLERTGEFRCKQQPRTTPCTFLVDLAPDVDRAWIAKQNNLFSFNQSGQNNLRFFYGLFWNKSCLVKISWNTRHESIQKRILKKKERQKKMHGMPFLERHHTRVRVKPCKQAQVWTARASGKATEAATERNVPPSDPNNRGRSAPPLVRSWLSR